MLRIEYFDKNRFMKQVAASRGSVILHLDNGSTCDLKKDNEASAIFQTLDAPKKGFSISVSDPADVTGFRRSSSCPTGRSSTSASRRQASATHCRLRN